MTRGLLFLAVLCCLALNVVADSTNSSSRVVRTEELDYSLYWGILPVGKAYITTRPVTTNGTELVEVTLRAKTAALVSKLYPVRHFSRSLIDPETLLSVRFEQDLLEGKKRRNDIATFDYAETNVQWVCVDDNETNNIAIGPETRDLLSYIYFMRAGGMQVGESKTSGVIVDEDLYEVALTCHEREEIRISRLGKLKCLRIEPRAKFGEVFVRKGKLMMWFSDDDRRICVKVDVKMPIAKVRAILKDVECEGDDFWGRKAWK